MLCHKLNVKISHFCDLKLYIKNKFIDWIVNNIWFKWNLICMLRPQGTWDSLIRFLKFTLKKEIYNKFENFLSKLIWRETLFILWGLFGGEKKMQKFTHILFLKKKIYHFTNSRYFYTIFAIGCLSPFENFWYKWRFSKTCLVMNYKIVT